jgi:predicted nucleotidyltransferase
MPSKCEISWDHAINRRGLIAQAAVRRTIETIAKLFNPEKIILFGSYAYGTPNPDSDLDLLVVMPTRNEINQSARIAWALDPPFALDVVVRTPKKLAWRLKAGDWFLREIMELGKVVYDRGHKRMDGQSGG